MDFSQILLIIVAGAFSGFVNTVASSGSAITLPLLIFLGLPANVANGTNRIPIVASSLVSLLTFHRAKVWIYRVLIAVILAELIHLLYTFLFLKEI